MTLGMATTAKATRPVGHALWVSGRSAGDNGRLERIAAGDRTIPGDKGRWFK